MFIELQLNDSGSAVCVYIRVCQELKRGVLRLCRFVGCDFFASHYNSKPASLLEADYQPGQTNRIGRGDLSEKKACASISICDGLPSKASKEI